PRTNSEPTALPRPPQPTIPSRSAEFAWLPRTDSDFTISSPAPATAAILTNSRRPASLLFGFRSLPSTPGVGRLSFDLSIAHLPPSATTFGSHSAGTIRHDRICRQYPLAVNCCKRVAKGPA